MSAIWLLESKINLSIFIKHTTVTKTVYSNFCFMFSVQYTFEERNLCGGWLPKQVS